MGDEFPLALPRVGPAGLAWGSARRLWSELSHPLPSVRSPGESVAAARTIP